MNRQPISDDTWERIRIEFTLPSLELVRRRLSELMDDPEPVMRQLVRVIDDGTFCPGFQFLPGGQLHPPSPSPGSTSNAWTIWPGPPGKTRQCCWTPQR